MGIYIPAGITTSDIGSISGTGADNRIPTFTDATNIQGEANLTFDGSTLTVNGAVTVGSDGSGQDVTFYSETAGDHFVWDASAEKLTITGTDGQTALDIADGNVTITDGLDVDGATTLDGLTSSEQIKYSGTAASGVYVERTGSNNTYIRMKNDTDSNGYIAYESDDIAIYAANNKIFKVTAEGDAYIYGATPSLTIGDGGDESNILIFDGSDSDYQLNHSSSGKFYIQAKKHSTANSGGSYVNSIILSADALAAYHLDFAAAHTSDGSIDQAALFAVSGDITGANGDTDFISLVAMGEEVGASVTTQNNSETIGVASTLHLSEPNLTANDTVTNAATLYIQNAPTEATNDYALFVDDGNSRFDGGVTFDGFTDAATRDNVRFKSQRTTGDETYLRIGRYGTGDDGMMQIGNNYDRSDGFVADNTSVGVSAIQFETDGSLDFQTAAVGQAQPTSKMTISTDGDVTIKGATPTLTIGDGDDEDSFIIFNADHDFYMGSGNTENAFNFGSASTMGSEMIWQAGTNTFYFVASSGVYVKDDINFYFGTGADYKMEYESSNTRWVMWTNDTNGSGGNEDIIRIEDGQKSIDANTTWDANVFDIYDDAMLLASSISPTANAYDFGKGVFKRGKEALIEAGVLKRYKDDGWIGYNDQRMAALLAGGIYQTRWLVDEMKEKISELENKVKALGG